MVKKHMKKAFTIVELVIVIAVIAILAGVLIPTFSGIIQKANYSADTQEVTILNNQLATCLDGIENKDKLKEEIDSTFGAGYFDNLEPRSAKQGYHYWFDANKGKIVLATAEEIDQLVQLRSINNGVNSFANEKASKKFKDDSFRSSLYNNFFLMDGKGSDFVEAISALSIVDSKEIYQDVVETLEKIIENDKDHDNSLANKLLENLSKTTIITNNGTFRFKDTNVNKVIFMPDTTEISADLHLYNSVEKSFETTTSKKHSVANVNELVIPKEIEKIASGALYFESDSAKIYVSIERDELANLFMADSTNATIICAEKEYNIEDGKITGDGFESNLEYSIVVTDFDIVCEQNDNGKVKLVGNNLYVAYDQKAVTLKAENFNKAGGGKDPSTIAINWSSDNPALATILDGAINIVSLPNVGEDYTLTITAEAVAGGYQKHITLHVVRIINASIAINGIQLGDNNNAQISYTGSQTKFPIEILGFAYNQSGVVSCEENVEITTSGTVFEIDADNNINLLTYEGTQTLTIKVGEYVEKIITITIIDDSASPFVAKFSENFLYRVGNGNDIKLETLFESDKPAEESTLTIYDASLTDANGNRYAIGTNASFTATYSTSILGENNAWKSQTVRFTGTGVAIIELVSSAGTTTIAVEVVNGTNVTSGSEFSSASNNVVLLSDITLGSTQRDKIFDGISLYGNGFAINAQTVVAPTDAASQGSGAHGIIRLNDGAIIDNVTINGPVYPEVQYANQVYFLNSILIDGSAKITNSYVLGARSAIIMRSGTVSIEDSIIEGGTYANMEITGGTKLTLENVKTVQTRKNATVGDIGKQVIGAGIVIDSAAKNMPIEIKGSFKQYNFVSENDKDVLPSDFQTVYSSCFTDSKYESFIHSVNGVKYFNAGFIIVEGDQLNIFDARTEKEAEPYSTIDASVTVLLEKFSAKVYTYDNSKGDISADRLSYDSSQFVKKQGSIKPSFSYNPNLPTEEQENITETYAYYKNGKIEIKLYASSPYSFNALDGAVFSKYGETIVASKVLVDGIQQANANAISFTEKGSYVLTYVITDNNYFDANGNRITGSIDYEYSITVVVSEASIPNAEIIIDTSKISLMYRRTTIIDLKAVSDYYFSVALLEGITIKDGNTTIIGEGKTEMIENLTFAINPDKAGASGKSKDWTEFKIYNNKLYFCNNGECDGKSATTIEIEVAYTGINGTKVRKSVTLSFSGSESSDYKNFTNLSSTESWIHTYGE